MPPAQRSDLRSLFDKVVDLAPIDRANFLRDLQFKSPLQYKELRNLLLAHEGPSAFFEQDGGIWSQVVPTDFTGRRFGAYSIVKEIGRGGMGAVYAATRADEAFHKTVAIKLISGIVLSDSFRRERQILAQLEHPNIARLLDGGATDDGLLYLIMEYVDGKPLDKYIEEHRLGVEEILKVFLQVASAVSFAHRNLIVHRDLKPSNIMVTEQGEVKLLDFGIAKVLDPNRDETTTVAVRLTPEFASPEQIRGESISTASDVYSLGVLLYHSLTAGARPYRCTSQAVPDIMQAVLDGEPPKPSSVAPIMVAKKLKGDLDNIILKAMAKEPERRYASVEQLREDIERHLTGRPVVARGAQWSYRAGKFIRRHHFAVGATALIMLSVGSGVISTMQQRAAAESRYQSVRSLATAILFEVNESLKTVPGALPARKQAVLAAVKHLEALADRSGNDPSLNEDLASAYEQTAEIMSSLFETPRDGAAMAAPALVRAIELREKLPESLKLAETLRQLGNNHLVQGQKAQAVAAYRHSIGTAEKQPEGEARNRAIGLAHSNLCTLELTGDCWAAVRMLKGMEGVVARVRYGKSLVREARIGEAKEQWEEAVAGLDPRDALARQVALELLGSFGNLPGTDKMRAEVLWRLGVMQTRNGERDQALESFEQALRVAGGGAPSMKQVVAFADACMLLDEEQVQQARRRLAFSTVGAANLLRAELDSTLGGPKYTRPLHLY
jgi:serine/threonine protein kinase